MKGLLDKGIQMLLGCFFFVAIPAHAQFSCTDNMQNSGAINSVITCQDGNYSAMINSPQPLWGFTNLSVENLITLSIDKENLPFTNGDFTYTLTLMVEGYTETDAIIINSGGPTPPLQQLGHITLTVDYDPASGKIETEKHSYSLSGMYYLQLTVVNAVYTSNAGIPLTQVDQDIEVQTVFTANRVSHIQPFYSANINATTSGSGIDVSWMPDFDAVAFDLEWVWIDEELPSSTDILFANNATRVRLDGNQSSYTFPQIYEKGYVVFRVRRLLRCGALYDKVCGDYWSYSDATPESISTIANLGTSYIQVSNGHENQINWISSMSFAEEGKHKAVVSYADGMLKSRQTVTKLNSTGKTVVAETIYDHVGRAAIQVLPVPSTSSQIGYMSNFNQNSDGKPYNWRDFELNDPNQPVGPVPEAMDDGSGAAAYYSANSTSTHEYASYLPESEGYPFQATQFYSTPSSVPKIQGGVGAAFAIGGGHETTMEYARASDNELVSLFGGNAGKASYYSKVITSDPNGQQSFQLVNSSGQTVATGLIGDAPGNVQSLGGAISIEGFDFMPENEMKVVEGDGWSTMEYEIRVWSHDVYNFDYEFKPEQVTDDCEFMAGFCWDCVYDFTLKVTNRETGEVKVDTTGIFGPEDFQDPEFVPDCQNSPANEVINFPVSLEPGYYIVQKSVKLSQEAIDFYADKYIADLEANHKVRKEADPDNETCVKTWQDFYDEELATVDPLGCDFTCEACQEELTDIGIAYGELSAEYTSLAAVCERLCTINSCEPALTAMLADLSPDGQYGLYRKRVETYPGSDKYKFVYADFYRNVGFSDYPLSIFNERNKHPQNTLRDGTNLEQFSFRTPYTPYLNAKGNQAYVLIDGRKVKPEKLSVEDFIKHWKPSWAYSLLPYHPEYIFYELCIELNGTNGSNEFDALMQNTESYQEAFDNGLLNPMQISSVWYMPSILDNISNATFVDGDPFFKTGGPGAHLRSNFLWKLENYTEKVHQNGHYSLWQTCYAVAYCAEESDPDDFHTCITGMQYSDLSTWNNPPVCDESALNEIWEYFKLLYYQEKQATIRGWRNKIAFESRQYNGCIGMDPDDYKSTQLFHAEQETWAQNLTTYKPRSKVFWNNNNGTYAYKKDPLQTCFNEWLPMWATKKKRFITDVYIEAGLSSAAAKSIKVAAEELKAAVKGQMQLSCDDQCGVSAASWIQDLEACAFAAGYATTNDPWEEGNTTYDALFNAFTDICTSDCRAQNVLQGSVTKDPRDNGVAYPSVKSAVKGLMPLAAECFLMAEQFQPIDFFLPPFLDDCGCDVLEENRQNYLDLLVCEPNTTLTEIDLLARDFDVYVSNEELISMRCKCEKYSGDKLVKERIIVPVELTCRNCASCEQLNEVYSRYISAFSSQLGVTNENGYIPLSTFSSIGQETFAVYANKRLDLHLTAGQYDELLSCCRPDCYLNGPADKAYDWLDIMNEFAVGPPPTSTSALISKSSGQETKTVCSDITHYNDLYAAFPTVGTSTIELYTAMKQFSYNSLPGGLFGLIVDNAVPASPVVLGTFRLEFMFEHVGYEDVTTVYGGVTFEDITKFTSVRVAKGMANNRMVITGLLDENKIPEGVDRSITMILTVHEPASGTNASSFVLHQCDPYTSHPPIIKRTSTTDIEWTIGETTVTESFTHEEGAGYLAFETGYIRGNISSAEKMNRLQNYLDEYHSGAFAEVRECEGGCTCGESKLSICQDQTIYMDHIEYMLGDLTGMTNQITTTAPGGVEFDLESTRGTAFELPTDMIPVECTPPPTKMVYRLVEENEEEGTLTGRIEFVNCTDCYIYFEAEVENFDFDDITAILSIEPGRDRPSDDVSKNFMLTVTTSSTYCTAAGTASTEIKIYGYTDCWEMVECHDEPVFCDDRGDPKYIDPCLGYMMEMAKTNADAAYGNYLLELREEFRDRYMNKCLLENESEKLTTDIDFSVQHFTLYYYDQAKNLVRTVPPKGVNPICTTNCSGYTTDIRNYQAGNGGQNHLPAHTHTTSYQYNSLGGVAWQKTPDGGESNFYYDRLGRLVLSQNAVQKDAPAGPNDENFSYTIYDDLSRLEEVGQLTVDIAVDPVSHTTMLDPTNLDNLYANGSGSKEQVTKTFYDAKTTKTAVHTKIGHDQRNLIHRVAYTKYREDGVPDDTDYDHATYYSYDIGGNVDALVQDEPELARIGHDLKLIAYEFDLISGNVNKVGYQPGEPDQFYHRYDYDADNRIIAAETSHDDVHWTEDARYEYYDHGPLSRAELGGLRVQGMDYAYTLQGWLKAVNGNLDDRGEEIGEDGLYTGSIISGHSEVANDAFGFVLGYFDNGSQQDYKATNANRQFVANPGSFTSLYNGNIGYFSINHLATMPSYGALHQTYQYDQLHRIDGMTIVEGLNNNGGTMEWGPTTLNSYQTSYEYDANGNITNLLRNGVASTALAMDDFTYEYVAGTNRLEYVVDGVNSPPSVYTNDIENQGLNNYDYDAVGNLIQDVSEEIDEIKWNVYGKVTEVLRTVASTKPEMAFAYDASGNRRAKTVKNGSSPLDWTKTYYVRDVSGNVMATYTADLEELAPDDYRSHFVMEEQQLYGSSRLGIKKTDFELYSEDFVGPGAIGNSLWDYTGTTTGQSFASLDPNYNDLERGHIRYELSDHLGNVRSVISDRKLPALVSGNIEYNPDIASAQDYYPFGMLMPDRQYTSSAFTSTGYRYGFNGKEGDDDFNGIGNAYDFGARIYDPRLGRWNAIDPINQFHSPYLSMANNPIFSVDVDGRAVPVVVAGVIFLVGYLMTPTPVNSPGLNIVANERAMAGARATRDKWILGTTAAGTALISAPATISTARAVYGVILSNGQAFLAAPTAFLYNTLSNQMLATELAAITYSLMGGEDTPFPNAMSDDLIAEIRSGKVAFQNADEVAYWAKRYQNSGDALPYAGEAAAQAGLKQYADEVYNLRLYENFERQLSGVARVEGWIDAGGVDGRTMLVVVKDIEKISGPSGASFDKVTELAESMARENKLGNVEIRFDFVINERLKFNGQDWAGKYGYTYTLDDPLIGTSTVTWTKKIEQ